MTDERLEQILKEQLYTQFDTVGGLDPYITAMKIACAEAVEKGSISFAEFTREAPGNTWLRATGEVVTTAEYYKIYLQDQNKK